MTEEIVEQQEPIPQSKRKIILCNTDECTGCRICEYVCAVVNEGVQNPRLSRIRVIRIDPVFDLALACRKCEHPTCLDACARSAITQDPVTNIIHIDEEKCDGCGFCVEICNFGVLTIGIDKKVSFVCDTCETNNDGDPACVQYCPKEALSFVSIDDCTDERVKTFHQVLQQNVDVSDQ